MSTTIASGASASITIPAGSYLTFQPQGDGFLFHRVSQPIVIGAAVGGGVFGPYSEARVVTVQCNGQALGYDVLTVGAPVSGAGNRAIVGNRNRPPMYYQTNANSVHHDACVAVASSNANWSKLKFTFPGYYMLGAEYPTEAQFTIRASVEYNGTFYPITFFGARDWTFSIGASVIESDEVAGLSLPAGARYRTWVRRLTTAGDKVLVSAQGGPAFGEYGKRGTTVEDFTDGSGPRGARGYFTYSGGNITSLVITAGGSGYGSTCPVYLFDPAGTTTGTLIANVPCSGGAVTVQTFAAGFPVAVASDKVTPVFGSADFSAYCPCRVTGIPDRPTGSLVIQGDSNGAGFGASDGYGDFGRYFGLYERSIRDRIGIANVSWPSAYASNFLNPAIYPLTLGLYAPYATKVLVQAGGNDIGGGDSGAYVAEKLVKMAAYWRNLGAAVSYPTPVPRTTGTFTSAGGQTPASGFAVGAGLDVLAYHIRAQTCGLVSDFGVWEVRQFCEDATTPNVWRSDGGVAYTADGSHPSAVVGLTNIAKLLTPPNVAT